MSEGVPMIFIIYPALLIAMVPAMVLEIVVFNQALYGDTMKIVSRVGMVNAISMIIGSPLMWVLWLVLSAPFTGLLNQVMAGNPILQSILRVTILGAWLMPSPGESYWMLPTATLVGLIPAFFASVVIEGWLFCRLFKTESRVVLWRLTWITNLLSYALIALWPIGWLAFNLLARL